MLNSINTFSGSEIIVSSLNQLAIEPGTVVKGLWNLTNDPSGIAVAIPFIVVNGREDGPTMWIQGCIHGEEYAAAWAVSSLARELDPFSLKGRVFLFPILNRPAFQSRQNPTPFDNGDLHKSFPGSPNGSYTQQMAYNLGQGLSIIADYLIDVHAGTSIYRCIEFASFPGGMPASQKSQQMALASGSPNVVQRDVLAEYENHIMFMHAAAIGIPAVMISIGGHCRVEPQFVDPLKERCKSMLQYLGMLPGEASLLDPSRVLEGIFYEFTRKGGFVINEVENGSWLKKNQVISRLYNVYGEEVDVIHCPFNKALLVETGSGVLYPGELVAELFKKP